jgi:hypothetical protein
MIDDIPEVVYFLHPNGKETRISPLWYVAFILIRAFAIGLFIGMVAAIWVLR